MNKRRIEENSEELKLIPENSIDYLNNKYSSDSLEDDNDLEMPFDFNESDYKNMLNIQNDNLNRIDSLPEDNNICNENECFSCGS